MRAAAIPIRAAVLVATFLPLLLGSDCYGGGQLTEKHVLVVGIDGCRPDGLVAADTPTMDALIATGSVTYNAFAGGVIGTPAQQVTSSGPGWSSILTGVWTDKHGVRDNSFGGNNFAEFPHFFRRVKERDPDADLASIVSWGPIDDSIVAPVDAWTTLRAKGIGASAAIRDRSVRDQAVSYLGESDPDVLMLHFDQVDIAGHSLGYNAALAGYRAAISNVDGYIGDVMAAIRARAGFANEDWLVIITTDHGGLGTSHGGQSSDERTIFLITSREGNATREFDTSPGHTAVPPTAMKHLGLAIDPAWGWESEPFGLPPFCPKNLTCKTDPAIPSVTLSWNPAEELGIDGYELVRDDEIIAILDPETTHYVDFPPLPAEPGLHEIAYRLDFFAIAAKPDCDPLGCTASFFTGPLETDLVLHLALEGDADDSSPQGAANHGTVIGDARFRPGIAGQHLEFLPGSAVDLGQPADLLFGADTDFTVSLLVNNFVALSAAPPILANKDATDASARGWSIDATAGGGWHWNVADGARRADYASAPGLLADGRWHQIVVSHSRGREAVLYFDGREVSREDIARIGSLDSGLPTAVGNDATLVAPSFPGGIDEVMIWRRTLFSHEVRDLFSSYELGRTPFHDAVINLAFDGDSNDSSGRENHAVAGGSPVYGQGITGQAVHLDVTATPHQYLDLGTPEDLNFGAEGDFSVSLWVNSDGNFIHDGSKGDPALISNKNWRSGSNVGWVIAAGEDGRWQWNIGDGTQAHRLDYDGPPGQITDGGWHHIAVSHDRDGLAALYFDGELVATRHIDEVGDIDSGLPTVIGSDGLMGTDWPAWFNGKIDKVQVWRRVVPAAEVRFIFRHYGSFPAWQQQHFTAVQLADPDISAAGADPDEDRWHNLQEFAAGQSPLIATPSSPVSVQIDSAYLFLTYRRRSGGFGSTGFNYSADGITYVVERSLGGNLDAWESGADVVEQVGDPIAIGDGPIEKVTVCSRTPIRNQARQHLRLRTVFDQ